jgi:TonB family protein
MFHLVVLILLVSRHKEEFLNLARIDLKSSQVNDENKIFMESSYNAVKKLEKKSTNVITNNAPANVLNNDEDLSKYTEIKSAPQFVTPIYSLVVYPEFEKENHIEGEVIYEVFLKSNGEIKTINILKATTKAMGDAVVDALWKAKIIPPYGAEGKPFACRFRQRLPFRIVQH